MLKILGTAAFAGAIFTGAVHAQERIELNFIYPLNQEVFRLNDGTYFTQDNRGSFEVVEGPLEDGAVRCIGSGFSGSGGNSVEGICIVGEDADTFTLRWSAHPSQISNVWTIVAGTGRFEGATGEGVATTGAALLFRAMPLRETHVVGTIQIPGN